MVTRVRSYSKINLGLAIGPARADGFHGLATLYQTLALHDIVTVEARRIEGTANREQGTGESAGSVITLTTNYPGVPTDERNTAWKMVALALERLGIAAEVRIHIKKDLPVQGGLGAGSANAAAALMGLERELGLRPGEAGALSEDSRLEIAAKVGSDVPLFLIGGAVEGKGRGEIVSAMADLPATPCVVAVPGVGVSTPRAFQEWDVLFSSLGHKEADSSAFHSRRTPRNDNENGGDGPDSGLTGSDRPGRLDMLSHVYASVLTAPASDTSGIVHGIRPESKRGGFEGNGPDEESQQNGLAGNPLLALVRTGIENDFEQVVFPEHPSLRDIKRLLLGPPDRETAIYAALSGSGSALFGLYRTEEDAIAAQQRVQDFGCRAIVTSTLPRTEYWSRMFAD